MHQDVLAILKQWFRTYNRRTHYGKGEMVVRAGEKPPSFFMVAQGIVRQYSVSAAGEELTVSLYSRGAIFYLPWYMGVKENVYYFETLTPTAMWSMPQQDFFDKLDDNPRATMFLVQAAYLRLQLLLVHMETLVYGRAREKVASVLALLATWYGKETAELVRIQVPLTHRLLATMVGMTRETTSEALMAMKKEGLISYRGQQITVHNLGGLKELAGIYLDYMMPTKLLN